MQLVNMDVERNGSRSHTRLGPFSPGLNAICGPRGSGKTTLLNWLRHITTDSLATVGSSNSVPLRGSIELSNGSQRWRIDSPGAHALQPYAAQAGNLTTLQRDAFAALAAASGSADTEAALESIAKRFGLDTLTPTRDDNREHLLTRQREVESRLQRLRTLDASRDSLLNRRQDLEQELHAAQATHYRSTRGGSARVERPLRFDGYPQEHRRYDERFSVVEADLRDTLARIEELDRQLAELRGELKVLETTRAAVTVDDSYRLQLQEIDDRLTRWRQTLKDLKAHRNRIEHDATDARLDKQVGEQLSATKEPDPRAALRSLEAQILSARNQLDTLVDRYSVLGEPRGDNYAVHQDNYGRTRIAYHDAYRYSESGNLPETLRSMQKDLYEACQQLARHESRAASETLKQQSEQLQRCEAELMHSVEKLIEERAALLRKIADEYQLSNEQLALAFGNWCDCHDHHHLQDWLLNETETKTCHAGTDPLVRQRLLEQIEAIEGQRREATVRAEHCKRQLHDAEFYRRDLVERLPESRGRSVVDIERDLQWVVTELREWDDRERLVAEADDLRRQLAITRAPLASSSRFRDSVHRHIAGLMGGRGGWASHAGYRTTLDSRNGDSPTRRYDLVDGLVYDNVQRVEADVPPELVRVALRLAIAESLAARSEPIAVTLDEALDHVLPDLQQSAVAHLAQTTAGGQQVIVLTADQRVADLVLGQRGWVGYLQTQTHTGQRLDVNRQLTALANDYEADKWYQPAVRREATRVSTPIRNEFYLTERSLVEESPSIDSLAAERCRALGVDRIGDLLDVDPHWLAEQLRLDGVSEPTVASWQAEARLLCSVRQLRPFDARLLVSIGIRTPQELAQMHPSQLLDRVERFVATDRGRRLLRSGSSYELSRITTWIASAKGGAGRYGRSNFADGRVTRNGHAPDPRPYDRNYYNGDDQADELGDNQGYAYDRDFSDRDSEDRDFESRDSSHDRDGRWSDRRSSTSGRRERGNREPRGERTRTRSTTQRNTRDYPVLNGSSSSSSNSGRQRTETDRALQPRASRTNRSTTQRTARETERSLGNESRFGEPLKLAQAETSREGRVQLKFYLELSSPVVDAPSIGPRMATRLEQFGIHTVDQLLATNAESLTDKLNLRRVDASTIRGWQEQARLVCRIPNLRGHDAQLLVACNVTSPEELATMNAASLLAQVLVVADSSEGQRILRGSKNPDLAEVNDWIDWASHCRSLNAA